MLIPPGSGAPPRRRAFWALTLRSEEHTSELQSQSNLVCRLLLEKKTRASDLSTAQLPYSIRKSGHTSVAGLSAFLHRYGHIPRTPPPLPAPAASDCSSRFEAMS